MKVTASSGWKLATAAVFSFSVLITPAFGQARKGVGTSASVDSQAKAMSVVERAINALGGLEAIRETQDVQVKVRGFSYARNQSVSVDPPYDKMTRDEDLYIDLRNRRYIIETAGFAFDTRDPLPGGFVFGGKQVITGNQGFFVNPRDKTIGPLHLTNFHNIGIVRRVPHLFLIATYENATSTLRWRSTWTSSGKRRRSCWPKPAISHPDYLQIEGRHHRGLPKR